MSSPPFVIVQLQTRITSNKIKKNFPLLLYIVNAAINQAKAYLQPLTTLDC